MDMRTMEAIRYLGYGRHEVDAKTKTLIEEAFGELETLAKKMSVYQIYDLAFPKEGQVNLGNLEVLSRDLSRNLSGCQRAYVFGATLGTEVDRQIRKYEVTDISKAVVFQACAAAYLEEYCDWLQDEIACGERRKGCHIRPRFSPGYGDFSIFHQKEILSMLNATKQIGLSMTEAYMLTPSKSVTAVIGVADTKE